MNGAATMAKVTLRAKKNGRVVFEEQVKEYTGLDQFPEQHLGRPDKGKVELYVDDSLIATQVSMADEGKG